MDHIYQLVYRFSTSIIVILSLTNCSVDSARDVISDIEEQPRDLPILYAFTATPADIPYLLEKEQGLEVNSIDNSGTFHIGAAPYVPKKRLQNKSARRYQLKSNEEFQAEVKNLSSSENVLPKLVQDSVHTAPRNLEQKVVKCKYKEQLQPKTFDPEEEKSIKLWLSNIYLSNIPRDTAVPIASSLTKISKQYKTVFLKINSVEDYNKMKFLIKDIYAWKAKKRHNASISDNTLLKIHLILSCNIIYPYIEGLIKADFFDNLELSDKKTLVTLFYALNFDIATTHLDCLSNSAIPLSPTLIKKHVEEYKNAKNRLKSRIKGSYKEIVAKYIDMLSKDYELNLKSSPHINQLFNVPTPQNFCNSERRPSLRMLEARRKSKNNYTQKILKEMISSHGISNSSTNRFLLQEMDLIERLEQKGISNKDWIELSKQYVDLENAAISMLLDAGKISKRSCPLKTPMQWTDLYAKIEEHLVKIDLYGFMRNGVTLYIYAKCYDEAKIRLKAMEDFYANKIESLPKQLRKDLQIFQASVYALYSDYTRLAQLYRVEINNKIANKKKGMTRHQKAVTQLKNYRISQLKAVPTESVSRESAQVLPALINKVNASTEEAISEVAYQEQQQRKSKEMADRIKRHQQAEKQRIKENMPNHLVDSREKELSSDELENEPIDTAAVSSIMPIHFYLQPKAYNIISKIFANDWKLTRIEVEDLFDNLGQNIDISTKSSHHIIKVSQGILLVDQDGQILGIMHGIAEQARGHLSLPDWEKVVPEYMRSQILNLIHLIGINKENYSKGNVYMHTNCIPIENIANTGMQPTQTKPTISKRKKKSKQTKKSKRAN